MFLENVTNRGECTLCIREYRSTSSYGWVKYHRETKHDQALGLGVEWPGDLTRGFP